MHHTVKNPSGYVTRITQVASIGYNRYMADTDIHGIVDAFFSGFPAHEYFKGAILIRAADEPKGIYYLKSGHIRQYVITKEGEEITLNIYKPGAFFPMAWAVNAYPNHYYFEAMDDSVVRIAPKEDAVEFVKNEPDVLFDLLQRLYIGLDGVLSRMEHLMSGKARERLITILIISAKRFGRHNTGRDAITIDLRLTHQDLASLAGLSRETVTREMMELKQSGLLDYTNTAISIQNITDLEKAVS